MSALLLPKRFAPGFRQPNKKPLGSYVIDWSNPLTRGLEAAFVKTSGDTLVNLVNPQKSLSAVATGDVTLATTKSGQGFSVDGGTTGGLTGTFKLSSTSKYSMFYAGRIDYMDSSNRSFMMGQTQPLSGSGYDYGGPYFGASFNPYFYPKNGANVGASRTYSNGEMLVWGISYTSGETNGTRQFLDGVLDGVKTITGAAGSAYNFQIGRRWSGINQLDHTVNVVYVWTRPLSDAEHKKLADDYYQILKPATPHLFLVPASSGTTVNAALESISLSTFQSNVSLDTDIAAALESINVTTNAATVQADIDTNISGALEAVSITTNAATVQLNANIAAALESISLSTYPASLGVTVNATTEAITLSTFLASISADTSISAALESITLTTNQAGVTLGTGIAANTESITVTTNAAQVSLDVSLSTAQESILLTTLNAQVGLASDINANLESLTITPLGAVITLDTGISATLENLTLTTFSAAITSGAGLTIPGLEYTIEGDRLHYTLQVNRLHFTFE